MPAYLVSLVTVTDPEPYSEYAKRAPAAIAKYGGRILARGGRNLGLEGPPPPPRIVLIEFESLERAEEYYHSPEYQDAKSYRDGAGTLQIMVVEGV
ncbi:MAG TPA: DUF1330 domain-containing protein [Rhodospirillales bacterium]|nr:DUF1330 domain-containing protein [Rhodospirillales bacterium]HJO69913.1 DUF1330 domain-containing protein [Rhodospirillales bacterium]